MENIFSSEIKTGEFISKLKDELYLNLPGVEAHLQLAPEMRKKDMRFGNIPANAQESAVLILLYPYHGRLHTVVTLRNEYNGAHSGQVSLPGGKREKQDIDFKETALRETKEEIGVNSENMEVLGQLSRFYVQPSNYIVYPFISFQAYRPDFHPDTTEVRKIIEIDIFAELNPQKIEYRTINFKNNIQITAPGFPISGEFMWGATAMIFSELLHVLKSVTSKL